MKNLFSLVFVSAIAGALLLASNNASSQSQAHRMPGIIVLSSAEVYPEDGKYHFEVFASSSGSNSPSINLGSDLAQTLEYLKGLGYRITIAPYNTFICERD